MEAGHRSQLHPGSAPCWPAATVPEGAIQTAGGEKHPCSHSVPDVHATILTCWQNVPTGTTVAQWLCMAPTVFWLNMSPPPIPRKGIHAWYSRHGQKFMTGETTDPYGGLTVAVFLSGHTIKLYYILKISVVYHRCGLLSTLVKDASFYSGSYSANYWRMHKLITGH